MSPNHSLVYKMLSFFLQLFSHNPCFFSHSFVFSFAPERRLLFRGGEQHVCTADNLQLQLAQWEEFRVATWWLNTAILSLGANAPMALTSTHFVYLSLTLSLSFYTHKCIHIRSCGGSKGRLRADMEQTCPKFQYKRMILIKAVGKSDVAAITLCITPLPRKTKNQMLEWLVFCF